MKKRRPAPKSRRPGPAPGSACVWNGVTRSSHEWYLNLPGTAQGTLTCKRCGAKQDVDTIPTVHIPGYKNMPRKTQEALGRMFAIIAKNYQAYNSPTPPHGSCLICGHDKPFSVYRGDVGVCFDCRDAAQKQNTELRSGS